MKSTIKLLESIQLNLTEAKNTLYYCKIIEYNYFGTKQTYYVSYEDNRYNLSPNISDAIALAKSDWDKVLGNLHFSEDSKISYIKAPDLNEELITFFYIPHRDWQGTWGLSQLKQELKKSNINVIAIKDDIKYYKYGGSDKYYRLYVPKSQEEELKKFINVAKNMADVSLDSPF